MKSYHIVTHSYDSGEDSKQDAKTLKEAIKYAKDWLKDEYYNNVKIFCDNTVVRKYINADGRALRTI